MTAESPKKGTVKKKAKKAKKKTAKKKSAKKKGKKKKATTPGVKFVPSPEQRGQVEAMAGLGLTHDEIAIVMEVASSTIEKHFKEELRRGVVLANLKVTKNLFKIATGDTTQAMSAAIFWKKVRSRWHEVQRIIHGFDPGVVTEFVTEVVRILKKTIPDLCPHCKTNINLKAPIVKELKELSARLASTLPAPEIVPINPELAMDKKSPTESKEKATAAAPSSTTRKKGIKITKDNLPALQKLANESSKKTDGKTEPPKDG